MIHSVLSKKNHALLLQIPESVLKRFVPDSDLTYFEVDMHPTSEKYQKLLHHLKEDFREMYEVFPVICGEWCLFNSLACGYDTNGGKNVFNNVENVGESVIEDDKKAQIYRRLAKLQIDAWNQGSGYFYWNYKLLIDTVNEQ